MSFLSEEERRVIVFVCIVSLVGAGINYIAKRQARPAGVSSINKNICKINLNSANVEDLIAVKGIGKKLAERIIRYRAEKDRFENIEELMNIEGINNYRFKSMEEMVYLE